MENTQLNFKIINSDESKRHGAVINEGSKQKEEKIDEEKSFEDKRMNFFQGFEFGEKSTKNENSLSLSLPLPPPPPLPTNDASTIEPVEGGEDEKKSNKEEEALALRDIEVDSFVMDRNIEVERPVVFYFDLNELPTEVDKNWW
ncbi:hypothetical protein HN51_000874 [Arachis hypogaea]|nr:uncharacterized protein LOC114924395 [Arachis hypogaea]QHO48870.1 uncharacterized protein DS421_1g09090 [Arachis hypogaea]